jgi:2-C-methyl-D-erythritol 4-phosphate cytidylyltransferase
MSQFSVLLLTAPPPGTEKAGGNGAFVKVDGRESLLKAAELFLNRDPVKQIQVVITADQIEEAKRKYGGHFGFSGIKLITGGPRWIDQIVAAREKISPDATHVVVHDAARPAVAYSDIDALLEASAKATVAALATPLRAGLVETDEGGNPIGLVSPERYQQLVTPIVYTRKAFDEMAEKKTEPHASLYTLVKGLASNLRLSGAADAGLVSAMIKLLPKPKIKAPDSPFDEAQW